MSKLVHPYVPTAKERHPTPMIPPSSLVFPQEGVAGLSFTARIERAPFHRARSASKKDGLAAPFPLFAKSWKRFVKMRRARASFTRGPGGLEDD